MTSSLRTCSSALSSSLCRVRSRTDCRCAHSIKPNSDQLVIADFGIAKHIEDNESLTSLAGSPGYAGASSLPLLVVSWPDFLWMYSARGPFEAGTRQARRLVVCRVRPSRSPTVRRPSGEELTRGVVEQRGHLHATLRLHPVPCDRDAEAHRGMQSGQARIVRRRAAVSSVLAVHKG